MAGFLDHGIHTDAGELVHTHHPHSPCLRKLDTFQEVLPAADADLYGSLWIDESVLDGKPERRTVVKL